MSAGEALPSSALPAGAAASAPAWVRHGSASVQSDYAAGLAFEQLLATQLASSLTATAGLGEESGESEEGGATAAGGGALGSLLPQALATSVTQGGGLGLAAQLTREMQGPGATPAAAHVDAANGGTGS